jgi:hypothetical protein
MKFRLLILVSFVLLNYVTHGQQNLFNMPSGDITPKGKFFYQHQLNMYDHKFESKGHFVYGLGKGWDVGANLVGKGAYFGPEWRGLYNSETQKGALYPILMATLQKQFVLNNEWAVNVGTQTGFNLSNKLQNKQLAYYHYGLVSYQIKPGRKFVAGPYVTNRMFVGNGNNVGMQVGYEWKLNKNWYLMGDFISGNNDAAVFVPGIMYNVSKRVQLCLGYMVPNPNTPKPQAVVFEFNWYGWNFH